MYLKTPRIGSPFCIAKLLFIRRTAPAPSVNWLAFPKTDMKKNTHSQCKKSYKDTDYQSLEAHKHMIPAVVLPFFLNAGFSFAKSAMFVFGRIPSSTEIVTGISSPVFGFTIFMEEPSVTNI